MAGCTTLLTAGLLCHVAFEWRVAAVPAPVIVFSWACCLTLLLLYVSLFKMRGYWEMVLRSFNHNYFHIYIFFILDLES